jgi:hypothetical protein
MRIVPYCQMPPPTSWVECQDAAGQSALQQLRTNNILPHGIDSHAVANWAHGFSNGGTDNKGRFGKRNNAAGAWIGGGGKVQQLDRPGQGGLTPTQRTDTLFNLDWLH